MVKAVVFADDLTGSMDTAVKFVKAGIRTRVIPAACDDIDMDCEVLVIDTGTRHVSAEEAGRELFTLGKKMRGAGVDLFYKKTDSALRGNIGAELEGLLMGTGSRTAYFAPALPALNRVTRGGIHYVDGVTVDRSAFGRDPFEPVTDPDVSNVVRRQTDLGVTVVGEEDEIPFDAEGIVVLDAESNERLAGIAGKTFVKAARPLVLAGCSGFAEAVAQVICTCKTLSREKMQARDGGILVVSGSLNARNAAQIKAGVDAGYGRVILDSDFKASGLGSDRMSEAILAEIKRNLRDQGGCIVDVGNGAQKGADPSKSAAEGRKIAEYMGELVNEVISSGFAGTLVIVGGDTLTGILSGIDCALIDPICEIEPGVVFATGICSDKQFNIVTKSGGIGSEDVFAKIREFIACSGEGAEIYMGSGY